MGSAATSELIIGAAVSGGVMVLFAWSKSLIVAFANINWYRLPQRAQDVFHLVPILHRLQSGYIGDYVVWFMVGAGAILAVLTFPGRGAERWAET